MRYVSSSVVRGVTTFAVIALLLFPLAAFADAGQIGFPPGAPVASPPPSTQAEIGVPPGFWGVAFLVWLEVIA
jgi:hypothetical protein